MKDFSKEPIRIAHVILWRKGWYQHNGQTWEYETTMKDIREMLKYDGYEPQFLNDKEIIDKKMYDFIDNIFKEDDLEELYYRIIETEENNKKLLLEILEKNPSLNNDPDIALSYLNNFSDDFTDDKDDYSYDDL